MSNDRENRGDIMENYRRNYNIATWVATICQRGIVLICRNHWGTDALGAPCAFALLLMAAWAAFSKDIYMWGWIALWLVFLGIRRKEANRITGQVDSRYDGWPFDAIRYCGSEKVAKKVLEPLFTAVLGAILYWVYTTNGLLPYGLPYFLFAGAISIAFVASTQQMAWDKRLRDMRNAQLENQQLVDDYKDHYGR